MRASVVLAVAVAVATPAYAQQADDKFDRAFDEGMRRAAPAFRHEPRPAGREGAGRQRTWTSDGLTVSVLYFVRESAEAAARLLRDRVSVLPIPVRRTDEFGDESYLLAPYDPNGERRIWFRRGVVLVEVAAPGEEPVRRFAALFADALGP